MGMRDYAVDDYGLLMTTETLKIIASQICDDYTEEDYNGDEYYYNDMLYDADLIDYISDFTGEAMEIDNNGKNEWNAGETYNCDRIYYVPIGRISTLFKATYNSMDELVNEFKEKLGEYLPDDFDYRGNIRRIVGTYYG
jgi:hypothetical protein